MLNIDLYRPSIKHSISKDSALFNITQFNYQKTLLILVLFTIFIGNTDSAFSAEFVGAKQCNSCHPKEVNAWQGSHHAQAMQHANKSSVLGDFNNVHFNGNHFFSKIVKSTTQFWVNIKGKNGKFADHQIKYTFGVSPLQQYMVEFDDGRVQLIPFAWDSRAKKEGGQRWFNLYPKMTDKHQEFFWTNTGQNWNYMCADCHSTNVKKNFDVKTNSYNTTFSEINVSCESCHGAASEHINWTKDKTINHFGFNRNLATQVKNWQFSSSSKTLQPNKVEQSQQVLTCAQCHSRRTQISNNTYVHNHSKDEDEGKGTNEGKANKNTNAFGERYLLDLISNTNYYPDGQVYNENFVYGSFLQSKMYQKGVVCSDCHDPHSAKLKLPVESLCLQCHQRQTYAQKSHHQHQDNSTGSQCVNCHMPQTTYMKIDDRRDHSFNIPRPDLALQLGTPDTCLNCHKNKDSHWSLARVNAWYSNPHKTSDKQLTQLTQLTQKTEKDFAAVFSATNLSLSNQEWQTVANELSRISQTLSYAPIIRASALTKMADTSNTNTLISIARALKNDNEYIRLGAVLALQGRGAQTINNQKWRLLYPLLTDNVLAIRTSAAFTLASLWPQLNPEQKKHLTPALNEYLVSQNFNDDRSFAHANKGIIYSYQGKYEQAITTFKQGIEIEPNFPQTYINLSQIYRQLKQSQQEINTLKQGFDANPDNSQLPFELAMSYIRAKDKRIAASYLRQAIQLSPNNSHYFYVLGLSLEKTNKNQAYKALAQAYKLSQSPQHLYALCDMQVRHNELQAKQCIAQLVKIAPAKVVDRLTLQLKAQQKNQGK